MAEYLRLCIALFTFFVDLTELSGLVVKSTRHFFLLQRKL